ncbi:hypothetical protein CEXT_181881 [Caerostris extrusa]|uniref:Uncharacterized protein n=1 Tax=Caerostris extrusa TaxID=172846 RepID=A0AAV4QNP1_CAEEX|nr:hypothetical protein CEXT_181881 [Caerostris extrusa]
MKSIRRNGNAVLRRTVVVFEQSSSESSSIEDRCCSFLPNSYSIHPFPYPPPPLFEPFCQKKEGGDGGWAVVLVENS